MLVLDAGNALFKTAAPADEQSQKRAEFILRSMGELGTSAMAVGARDLPGGTEFLKKAASRARVQLLSANLADGSGKLLFSASRKVSVAGVRVGLLAISPAQEAEGVHSKPPVQAAIAEARKLRGKVDLIIALAAVPYADALQLSKEAGSAVDFILQSHESRGTGIPQGDGSNYVIPTGERGRQLGRLELELSGSGRWVDAGRRARNEQLIKVLDAQIAEARKRLDSGSAEAKKSLLQTMQSFQARRDSLAKESSSLASGAPRSLKLDFLTLDTEYADDPQLKAQVAALEPQPSASEP